MKDLEKPKKIIWDKKNSMYGKLIVEPLERGYGVTIGNALRRILLSSLPGSAVTSIKIDGVMHEFSTIPGVLEDVLNIVLNIKNLLVKLEDTGPEKIYIKAKGVKEIKASDIIASKKVKIINADLHIATLTESSSSFNMEMTVEEGKGYIPSEMNKKQGQPIGVIPIDSIFSPVRRVNFAVEEARVGQITNYDRLIIEIWTDGRIAPDDALTYAARVLRNHSGYFLNLKEDEEDASSDVKKDISDEVLKYSIDELELSVRALNGVKSMRVKTIGELVQKAEVDFLKLKNFGKKSLNELKEKLGKYHLTLALEKNKR